MLRKESNGIIWLEFELFQELDRFNLGDYQRFDDQGRGMQRLIGFVFRAAQLSGWTFRNEDKSRWVLDRSGEPTILFTTDRDEALQDEDLQLLGLEHPITSQLMHRYSSIGADSRAVAGRLSGLAGSGLLTIWKIDTQG